MIIRGIHWTWYVTFASSALAIVLSLISIFWSLI